MARSGSENLKFGSGQQLVTVKITVKNIKKLLNAIELLNNELQQMRLPALASQLVRFFPHIVSSIRFLRESMKFLKKIIRIDEAKEERNFFVVNAQNLLTQITHCWNIEKLTVLSPFAEKFPALVVYGDADQFVTNFNEAENALDLFNGSALAILNQITDQATAVEGDRIFNNKVHERIRSFSNFIKSLMALLKRLSDQKYLTKQYLGLNFNNLIADQKQNIQLAITGKQNLVRYVHQPGPLDTGLWLQYLSELPLGHWCVGLDDKLNQLRTLFTNVLLNPFCNLAKKSRSLEMPLVAEELFNSLQVLYAEEEFIQFIKCFLSFLAERKFPTTLHKGSRLISIARQLFQQRIILCDQLLTNLRTRLNGYLTIESTLLSLDALSTASFETLLVDFNKFIQYTEKYISHAEFVFLEEFCGFSMDLSDDYNILISPRFPFVNRRQSMVTEDHRRGFINLSRRYDCYVSLVLKQEDVWFKECEALQGLSIDSIQNYMDKIHLLHRLFDFALDHLDAGRFDSYPKLPEIKSNMREFLRDFGTLNNKDSTVENKGLKRS